MVVLLPSVGPVLLSKLACLERADGPDGVEVPERLLDFTALRELGAIKRQVGANDDRRPDDSGEAVVSAGLDRLFDRDAARRDPAEDLADGLDRLAIDSGSQL